MDTHGTLLKSGHIDATTRTRTETDLGGFHGAVQILLEDANGQTIGNTAPHVFGVDGKWIGRSDRTDYWTQDLDPSLTQRTTAIHVLHFWAPQYSAFKTIVDKAVETARPIVELLNEAKSSGGDAR